jgi:hypothetical protein
VNAATGAATQRRKRMKFMVSLISDGTVMKDTSPEERQEFGQRMGAFMGELQEAGALADPGAALGPSADARTLRYGEEGRAVVTDGPFAESKEQTAGYMILECDDLDAAMGWVERMPVLGSPSVEVRALMDPPG